MCSPAEKNRDAPYLSQQSVATCEDSIGARVAPAMQAQWHSLNRLGSGVAGMESRGGPLWLSRSGGNARRTAAMLYARCDDEM